MLIIRFLIRDAFKDLYWIDSAGGTDPFFTMYPKKATKFKTYDEAETAIKDRVKEGIYLIDKFYVKQDG